MCKLFKILSYAIIVFLLLIVFLFASLHLRFVQEIINNAVSKYTYDTLGYYVSFKKLSLLSLPQIYVQNITISNDDAVIATIDDISLPLIPEQYSKIKVTIAGIKIKKISLLSIPSNNKNQRVKKDNKTIDSKNIDGTLKLFKIQEIAIEKLILTKNITKIPEDIEFNLSSNLTWDLAKKDIVINSNINSHSKLEIFDKIKINTNINYNQHNNALSIDTLNIEHQAYNIAGNLHLDMAHNNIKSDIEYNSNIIYSLLHSKLPIDSSSENGSFNISGALDKISISTKNNITIDTSSKTNLKFPNMNLSGNILITKEGVEGIIDIKQDKVKIANNFAFKNEALLINDFKSEGVKLSPDTKIIITGGKIKEGKVNLFIPHMQILTQYFRSLSLNGRFDLKSKIQNNLINLDTKINLKSPYKIETHIISEIIKENKDVQITISRLYNKTNHVKVHNTDPISILLFEDQKILTAKNIKLNDRNLHINSTILNNKDISAVINIPEHTDILSIIPIPEGHELSGRLGGNVNISGTIANPQITGDISIHKGEYQFVPYGIKIKNLATKITVKDNNIISTLSAQDAIGNKLHAKGSLNINNDFLYNADISFNQFYLFNNSDLHGAVTGDLKLQGNKDSGKIAGKLDLGPMNINIPHKLGKKAPKLNIVEEIHENETIIYQKSQHPIYLDITAKTTDKILLGGKGVNGLVQGALNITGKATKPLVSGQLKLRHGTFSAFGKVLKLTQAILAFNGTIPPSPYLNIVGTTNIQNEHDVSVILSGSISDPDFTIESNPSTNQEDALSLLLFGQKSDSISPMQALVLANTLRSLTQSQSSFDPFAVGRSILGVDNITVSGDGDSSPTIGVGKHLTENVYLEIEQGTSSGGTKEKIEIQLTPSISVDAASQHDGGNSVGINWRKDY